MQPPVVVVHTLIFFNCLYTPVPVDMSVVCVCVCVCDVPDKESQVVRIRLGDQ